MGVLHLLLEADAKFASLTHWQLRRMQLFTLLTCSASYPSTFSPSKLPGPSTLLQSDRSSWLWKTAITPAEPNKAQTRPAYLLSIMAQQAGQLL
jgi:hypothetical protein